MRIYISSTTEDLADYRSRAAEVIRREGHQAIYMDEYAAGTVPPLNKCLEDVAACDAYVGIFAWRYGQLAPGRDASITELEFREAKRKGKPTLIFILSDRVNWLPGYVDKGDAGTRMGRLRQELLAEQHDSYVGIFSDREDFLVKLGQSLRSLIKHDPWNKESGVTRGSNPEPRISLERLPVTGGELFGRDLALRELDEAWKARRTNIVCLVGPAGTGKTSLINEWLTNLATESYRGARAVFGWSFESYEADQSEVSADSFVAEALKFFGETNPPTNPAERGRRLAQVVNEEEAILILDGLEAVQHAREPNELKDSSVRVLLKMLAAQNRGLCLVSSFVEVFELKPSVGKMVKVIRVDDLSPDAGTSLLKSLGVNGSELEFRAAVDECRGHALSLTWLGAALRKYKHGNIERRNELALEELTDAGHRIDSVVRWLGPGPELDILKVLGLFNRPAESTAISAVRAAPAIPHLTDNLVSLSQGQWNGAVRNLRDLRLLSSPRDARMHEEDLDTSAIVRQQFGQRLREQHADAWREANRRLFEYYRSRSKPLPESIEEMAPLFRAVVHGCRAEKHQEVFDDVYWPRIRHDDMGYSVVTLNAWGVDLVAVSNFFVEGDWERPLPFLTPLAAARACTEASFDLRGHGRIDEAIGAELIGVRLLEDLESWGGFCEAAGNLSELRTLHADLAEAEKAARRSIEFAPRAMAGARDDAMLSLSANLATLGNVLLQRGQLAEAQEQFAAAEKTYRDVYPNHPYLARLPGYNYCDLLLTLGRLDEVEPRAAFIEEEATGRRPYGVALARLAMARRRTALVERGGAAEQSNALAIMADACAKLRQTGHTEMILRGLLASAELHRRTGFVDLAQTELDEVLESAARVQMKLLEADAHLQMAYTEAAVGNTSRKQVHVDLCRGMVQAFGYNRLEAELRALEGQQAETRPAALARANTAAGVSVLMSRMPPNDHGFARIQQEFTDLYLRAHPVDGTQLGMRENDNSLLPPMDPRERADLFASLTASAHALRAASEASGISDDIVDGELAVAGIRGMRIVEDALRPYARNPGVYLDAVVRGIYALLARGDLTVEEKLPALAQRMMAVPAYLARGQRQISRSPRVIVDNAVGDAEGGVQFLNNELRDFLQALPDDPRARDLEKKRVEAAEAVEVFRQFVIGLAATATDEFALGRAAFDALLRDVHQVRFDADELGDLGRSVVADLEADLGRAALKAAGHNRWWEAATSVEARYPTRESLLDDYRAVLERARHFVRDRDLVGLTAVGPLVVQATPPFARANLPFAAYVPAPPFASSGRGEFWVTPPSEGLSHAAELATLQRHHTGRLLVACVHEGYPGHHTQFDHAAHVNRPLRHFFASTVFSEGWGLYCEDLMRREGFMLDGPDGPGLEISMLRDQLWRALRIVIDVGLHCKEMTREQAVSLLVDKHVLDQDSAASEVMYYCSAPTQPMSYMVGRILMDSSIKKCAAARGHEVPLGRIRDEVLSHGSLPFPLLERSLGLHGKQP